MLYTGKKQGMISDFVSEDRGRGFEILANLIKPPKSENVVAKNSTRVWAIILDSLDVRIFDPNYKQKITEILIEIFQESDVPDLKQILQQILKRLQ